MCDKSICPICLDSLGKMHRTLQCGHKFHFKCIKHNENSQTDTNEFSCPYCRQEYENMILRERKLNKEQEKQKEIFVDYIKEKLNEILLKSDKKDKFYVVIDIYRKIIEKQNISMLLDHKFGFLPNFTEVAKKKIIEISFDAEELFENKTITQDEYSNFNNYKSIIMKKF